MSPIIVMQSLSIVRQIEVQHVDIWQNASYQADKKILGRVTLLLYELG